MLKNWEFWAVLPLSLGALFFTAGWDGRWQDGTLPHAESTTWFIRCGVLLMAIGVAGVVVCLLNDVGLIVLGGKTVRRGFYAFVWGDPPPEERARRKRAQAIERRRLAKEERTAFDKRILHEVQEIVHRVAAEPKQLLEKLNDFLREGRELKDEIRDLVDKWDDTYEDRARVWEQSVYDYLRVELPDYAETFRLDTASHTQLWQPNAIHPVADWGNFMDRRLDALGQTIKEWRERPIAKEETEKEAAIAALRVERVPFRRGQEHDAYDGIEALHRCLSDLSSTGLNPQTNREFFYGYIEWKDVTRFLGRLKVLGLVESKTHMHTFNKGMMTPQISEATVPVETFYLTNFGAVVARATTPQ